MPFMYNAETGQFRSGKGRLVQGEPFKANPRKDDDGKPVLKADGTPVTEFYVGIAFPKTDPDWVGLKGAMTAACHKEWAGKVDFQHAAFAFKWRDADTSRDKAGKLLSEKNPGTVGCDVLGLSRNGDFGLPQMYARAWLLPDGHPEKVTDGTPGPLVALDVSTAEKLFKRGYYVRVFGDRKSNETPKYPGQYVNLEGIELFEYGEEIVSQGSRPSGEEMFGDDAPTVGAPAPVASAPAPTASPSSPAPAPAPHTGYMQAPAPAAPAPAPAGPTLSPAGQAAFPGGTVQGFLDAGWTMDQLKAAGYLA
jgi:hypothetical protein